MRNLTGFNYYYRLLSCQTRPVILVGHSLGGIIIKAAFVKIPKNPDLVYLCESIRGLMFFGTPHRGMAKGPWEVIWGDKPPDTIIQDLKPGSEFLTTLENDFMAPSRNVDILTCFERVEMGTIRLDERNKVRGDGPPVLYDSQGSACLDLLNEYPVMANESHSMISKMSDNHGAQYHSIKDRLAYIVEAARTVSNNRSRMKDTIQCLLDIRRLLEIYLKTIPDALFLAEMNELDDILRVIKSTYDVLLDRSLNLDHIPNVLDKVAALRNLFDEALEAHRQDNQVATRIGQDPVVQAVPLILELKTALGGPIVATNTHILEETAKHLNRDTIVARRSMLEIPHRKPLNASPGTYEEIETRASGLKVGI